MGAIVIFLAVQWATTAPEQRPLVADERVVVGGAVARSFAGAEASPRGGSVRVRLDWGMRYRHGDSLDARL
jgi:hypothetical protein